MKFGVERRTETGRKGADTGETEREGSGGEGGDESESKSHERG